jgi:hypothetical protein
MASLSFREYLAQRPRRYTATSSFLFALTRDTEFVSVTTREDLDKFLERRGVGPNGQMHANAVWRSYLHAKKRQARVAVARRGA